MFRRHRIQKLQRKKGVLPEANSDLHRDLDGTGLNINRVTELKKSTNASNIMEPEVRENLDVDSTSCLRCKSMQSTQPLQKTV